MKAIQSRRRRAATVICRRWASRLRLAARSTTGHPARSTGAPMRRLSRAAALLTFIAHQDLVPEVVPDLLVDLAEARFKADLGHVSRAGKVDLVVALHSARTSGDDKYAIAERDRLFEVVGPG